MPRLLKYLGPSDSFDTGSLFDKRYEFTSPGELPVDAFGRSWASAERGQAVTVNNDHADDLLTHPWTKEHHRFVDVTEEAQPAPDVLASTDVVTGAKPATKEK